MLAMMKREAERSLQPVCAAQREVMAKQSLATDGKCPNGCLPGAAASHLLGLRSDAHNVGGEASWRQSNFRTRRDETAGASEPLRAVARRPCVGPPRLLQDARLGTPTRGRW